MTRDPTRLLPHTPPAVSECDLTRPASSDAAPRVAAPATSPGDALRHHRDAQHAADAAADDVRQAHGAQTHLLLCRRGDVAVLSGVA